MLFVVQVLFVLVLKFKLEYNTKKHKQFSVQKLRNLCDVRIKESGIVMSQEM